MSMSHWPPSDDEARRFIAAARGDLFRCAIENNPPRYGQQHRCTEQCPSCRNWQEREHAES